jgi:GT2 family glycosyltransferase
VAILDWAKSRSIAITEKQMGDGQFSELTPLTLLLSNVNGGYAYGVNAGIRFLAAHDAVIGYWVLNPDSMVPAGTPGRFLDRLRAGPLAMLSSRCRYFEAPEMIQTDGGHVSRWTGLCRSEHAGAPAETTPLPDPATLDFVTGANIVVPRAFVDRVGLMPEEYFLYYEEVDWAFRRGGIPIALVPDADIFHRGGTAIGSATHSRQASAFSFYFNQRNRMRFVRRHFPSRLPVALGWGVAKAAQVLLKAGVAPAYAVLAGTLGLKPPRAVAARIADPAARALAFGQGVD